MTTVAANATSASILSDDILRYPGQPSILSVQVAGDTASVLFMSIEVGATIVVDDAVIPLEAVAGAGPTRDRQFAIASGVGRGDQISIRYRNSSGAPADAITSLKVVPVGP